MCPHNSKNEEPTTPAVITEEQFQDIYSLAGGEVRYKKIVRWAKNTMSEGYQTQFNDVINSADVPKIKEQVVSLIRKWDTAYEADPEGTEEAARDDSLLTLGKDIVELMYFGEKYEGTSLEDRVIAMRMVMFYIMKEHEMVLERNDDLTPDQRTMFDVDLNKIKAAMDIVRDV